MSHTYVECTDSSKGDDTLIIIVNSDGTLSVDPGTLQKLLANQHQNSPISLVRFDSKNNGKVDDDNSCEDDEDPDSRVNLTVEGYYPPTPSSPTPPPTPVSETSATADGVGPDVLADSITEILQPEDVEKLETALQSEHAKEILGDVVLDMLQKNGEESDVSEEIMVDQPAPKVSVGWDHSYSLTGPPPEPPVTTPPTVVTATPTRGSGRGRGAKAVRGRGGLQQTKLTLPSGATMVPVVEQLIMPGGPVSIPTTTALKSQASVALQRIDIQQVLSTNVVPCKVMLNKVPMQSNQVIVAPLPAGAGDSASVKPQELVLVAPKKKGVGRGRGVSTRGKGNGSTRGRGQGRARAAPKISPEEEAKNKQLAEEMAATVHALSLVEAEQFANIESMDQSNDADRVIPLVNKVPVKKPIKVYRRTVEPGSKILKLLKPEKQPQKPKAQRKSVSSESSSHDEKIAAPEPKKEEKVIVVSMEPQITPAVVSAVVMSQNLSQPTVPPPTPIPTPAPVTPAAVSGHRKNYPKRENRKPPAHLAEAFGPALFSTPDIIRRVSTDKPTTPAPSTPTSHLPQHSTPTTHPPLHSTPTTHPPLHSPSTTHPPLHSSPTAQPSLHSTPTEHPPLHSSPTVPLHSTLTPAVVSAPSTPTATPPVTVTATPSTVPSATSTLEDELGLTDSVEPDSIIDTITSQVSKQEDQLLAEALTLDELAALPADEIVPEETPTQEPEKVVPLSTPVTEKKQPPKNKTLSQTSLSEFFPKVNPTKDEQKIETTVESPVTSKQPAAGLRKLPPIELPATRGATKRANQQKDQAQENQVKKQEVVKKVSTTTEKRKSTDSKKSTESRKSSGRSLADDSEEVLVSDEVSDDEGSYNSEDDPNRLWCICKRPHNNRFMICCDFCEDWFHGKCVGVTKAMGEQMEEQEIEWMCPNCKKKKKQEEAAKKQAESKNNATPSAKRAADQVVEEAVVEPQVASKEKKPEASKVIVQNQKLVVLGQETSKSPKGGEIRISKVSTRKSLEEGKEVQKVDAVTPSPVEPAVVEPNPLPPHLASDIAQMSLIECIVCRKEAIPGGVYCSDECIAKHTSDALAKIDKNSVVVFERKTGRIYGGPNAPTPATLTSWLMAHPSYEVMRPGVLPTAKYYNQQKPNNPVNKPTRPPHALLKQTVLQTRPHGIQLIAALPQPPPIEGPLKKNVSKAETTPPAPKPKPQAIAKGQQQITSLMKVQPKAEVTEPKPAPVKNVVTPPATVVSKKPVKEVKKAPPPPPAKKAAPPSAKRVVKEDVKTEQKREEGRGKDFEEQNVRSSVRNSLQEVLATRLQDVSDLKISDDQIKKIATQIEEELHALFKETNMKYKAKYRSLMFNIKDKNNLTLFRKIADKSISPVQLVRLTPEELASQELAQWREREARHQLEMIKKTELDLMQQAKTVVMKTHKGEQVVENEDGLGAKVLETSVEIEPVMNVSTPVTPTLDTSVTKPKEDATKIKEEKHSKKEKKEEKHKERRHSHKSGHHKEHHRSRSRHRSRHKSDSDRKSRSKSRPSFENKPRSRSVTPEGTKKSKERTDIKVEERIQNKTHPHEINVSNQLAEKERSKSILIEKSKPRERSKSRPRERSKSRPRERSKSSLRDRSKSRPRERSKSRPRERSKSRPRERSKSRHRERSKSRPRERSKSRPRERSKSRPRERSRSRLRERSKSRPRERSKSRPRERSKSKSQLEEIITKDQITNYSKNILRERSKSRPRNVSPELKEITPITSLGENNSQLISIEKVHEEIEIPPIQPAMFDEEIKEIIHDVVVEEEIGPEVVEDVSEEPSSTVNISTPPFNMFEDEEEPLKPPVWRGTLLMPDVAKFSTSIQEVSGICSDLEYDLPETIDCVGRISPETAWDYIAKMKKSGTKQILVVRFSSDNEEDKMSYLSFYSYLSSRNRLGVVGNNSKMIKDFYILPLPSHSPVPQVLLPLDGPGFEDYRPHLLLGIIVRTRRKRLIVDRDASFLPKMSKKSERSYTPPLPDEDSHTPTQQHQHPATESFTPPHSPKPPRIIKLKPKTQRTGQGPESPTVSEDFVLEDADTPYTPEDEEDVDAPYSPSESADPDRAPSRRSNSPGFSADLQRKCEFLQGMIDDIEVKKQKISTLSSIGSPQEEATGRQDEDVEEAYSPSGSITPPPTDSSYLNRDSLSALPLNLQEMIASIKKKPDSMDLKSDPIVQAYRTTDEMYSPEEEKESDPAVEEKVATPNSEESFSTQSSVRSASAPVKVSRDPRQRPAQITLNQLSDDEIMKKASEMGFMNPENPEPIPDKLKSRSGAELPPHPGLEGEYGHLNDKSQPLPVPTSMSMFMNQPFAPDFPPPPRPPTHLLPNFPPNQFPPHMFPGPPLPPMPPMPPSHIPYTNPQAPPQKPAYPTPPQQPAPLPPPPPCESPDLVMPKRKKSKKKSKEPRRSKERKERRRYSESPPPKDYDYEEDKFDKIRDRDRYSSKRREKRGETWRTYDKVPVPEKRRDSWEYEAPPPSLPPPPPQVMSGPPAHSFSSMRGGHMRGRYQRGMRGGFRRGFDRPMRGFHRGGFHQRGHHQGGVGPGPSRNFQTEYDDDIRRFEEQRLKQKNLERRRWRDDSTPPRKRRVKNDDSN